MNYINEYYDIIVTAWALITSIAAITPTEKDDRVVDRIKHLIKLIKR